MTGDMKIDYIPTSKKWDNWDIDHDYDQWKTIKMYEPYKPTTNPYIIDYEKITEKYGAPTEVEETYSKVKNWFDDYMKKHDLKSIFSSFSQPIYTSSNQVAYSNPVAMNTAAEPDVFTEYPPTNSGWTEYHEGDYSTIIPLPSSITQSLPALKLIDETHKSGTKVFTARQRAVRVQSDGEDKGHLMDPWNRSLSTFSKHFAVKLESRQQTKVESNSCEELLVWKAETTLKGKKVLLVIWETVHLSYVRKSTITNFLDGLYPTKVKLDQGYSV